MRWLIASDFEVECEPWKAQLADAGFFLGFVIGAGLWGKVFNRIGARNAAHPFRPQSCV